MGLLCGALDLDPCCNHGTLPPRVARHLAFPAGSLGVETQRPAGAGNDWSGFVSSTGRSTSNITRIRLMGAVRSPNRCSANLADKKYTTKTRSITATGRY